ncbi:MAG TPA: hypothetical protein VIM11_22995 [Tepidisphaeraceae bacterium]
MLYTITGADRSTGHDLTQTLDAKSPAEAESIASLTMFVSKVTPAPSPARAPANPAAPTDDLATAIAFATAATPVTYATPAKPDRAAGIDWSTGLATQARFLRILSWPIAASAVPIALVALRELLDSLFYYGPFGLLKFLGDSEFSRVIAVILLLSAAVLLRLVAHAALALRTLASSSEP